VGIGTEIQENAEQGWKTLVGYVCGENRFARDRRSTFRPKLGGGRDSRSSSLKEIPEGMGVEEGRRGG